MRLEEHDGQISDWLRVHLMVKQRNYYFQPSFAFSYTRELHNKNHYDTQDVPII